MTSIPWLIWSFWNPRFPGWDILGLRILRWKILGWKILGLRILGLKFCLFGSWRWHGVILDKPAAWLMSDMVSYARVVPSNVWEWLQQHAAPPCHPLLPAHHARPFDLPGFFVPRSPLVPTSLENQASGWLPSTAGVIWWQKSPSIISPLLPVDCCHLPNMSSPG